MRIVIIADEFPSIEGKGLSQTLYNVFSFVDPAQIKWVLPLEVVPKEIPTTNLFKNSFIVYRFQIIKQWNNRFGGYVNPLFNWVNYSVNSVVRKFNAVKHTVSQFEPTHVICCPNSAIGVFMCHQLMPSFGKAKLLPYLMDDWMQHAKTKWLNGNIDKQINSLFNHSNAWLMISHELSEILQKRYRTSKKEVFVVHNPVEVNDAPAFKPLTNQRDITIAYAGSLWPMHLDAFLVIAKAVQKLNINQSQNLVKVIVYTSNNFWNWRKNALEPLGVVYGGNIPYKDIHVKLSAADLLLITASFSEEWKSHSIGSLQTKMTDYLKSRRLVLACGPSYSANRNFIIKHDCGVSIETDDVHQATDLLSGVIKNLTNYQQKIHNGWDVLNEHFSFEKVHSKLKDFLSDTHE